MTLFLRSCIFLLFIFISVRTIAIDISKNIAVNFVTEANYYPFEYLDGSDKLQGFDIDIANAVCHEANLSCQFTSQSFDSLLLTLQFGRFDAVIAALDITEQRKREADFSNSYYQSSPVFITSIKDKNKFSLVGKFIGVQSKTSNYDYLIQHIKKSSFIISYQSPSNALLDFSRGSIDAVFADQAVIANFLLQDDNQSKFSIVEAESLVLDNFSAGYGIAVKKGNVRLLNRINFGLKKIHENGDYQQIFNKYFAP